MRVLLINWQDRLNPQAGGAEIHLHEIFGRLAGRGWEITLLASGWRGAPTRDSLDGIEVHRAGARYTFGLAGPAYFRRHLSGRGFDVTVEALNKVPVFAPLWAPRPAVLLVHHLFGTTAFREASLPLASMTWLLERPLPAVYRGLPAQAISRSTREDLADRGLDPRTIEVVYPGVDLDFFRPDPAVERFPEPTFLYLGRLKRYKGVELVIQALARLRQDGLPARLLIGGRGEWEPELRRQATASGVADAVDFLGFVTEERKRELFRRVWANVFPSPKEGWGITNLEAAGCGTATVASDAPGLRESVEDGRTGLLVPHGDVPAFAAAMRRLAVDRALCEALGAGALRFARHFTWDRAVDQTADHLRAAARAAD